MKDWSWRQLIAAHHDYHLDASEEILRRLVEAVPDKLDPVLLGEVLFRWQQALEQPLLDIFDTASFSMHRSLDPTTGMENPNLGVFDWQTLATGDVERFVSRAIQLARRRRSELDATEANPKLVERAADTDEPDTWKPMVIGRDGYSKAEQLDTEPSTLDPLIHDRRVFHRPAAHVLVAFNHWNRKGRPDDPSARRDSIEADRRRDGLEPLVDAIGQGQSDACRRIHAAVASDPTFRGEARALLQAVNALIFELKRGCALEDLPRLLSQTWQPGATRAHRVVAVWVVQNALRTVRPEEYPESDDGIYQPTGLRPDRNALLERWGYSGHDKVLRDGKLKRRYLAMHRAILATFAHTEQT